MPKRKIKDSLIPPEAEVAIHAAMKDALSHPHVLTPDEERDFLERHAHGAIERHEHIVTLRRGNLVYREHGNAGADLPVPPYYMDMLKRQRDFETECAKVNRKLTLRFTHQRKADERARRILELAKTITGHGRIKAIAREADCSVDTVRRALKRGISKVTDSK